MEDLVKEITNVSSVKIAEVGGKVYTVSSQDPGRPWKIQLVKDAVNPETGNIWEWLVDSQFFSKTQYASDYLKRLIAEKQTGVRIIRHKRGLIPEICGNGIDCRYDHRGYFTMLCSGCPKAEQMQAEKDGVTLSYQPEETE
jgi:hypothetical protein